jgi:hypothetical protein
MHAAAQIEQPFARIIVAGRKVSGHQTDEFFSCQSRAAEPAEGAICGRGDALLFQGIDLEGVDLRRGQLIGAFQRNLEGRAVAARQDQVSAGTSKQNSAMSCRTVEEGQQYAESCGVMPIGRRSSISSGLSWSGIDPSHFHHRPSGPRH